MYETIEWGYAPVSKQRVGKHVSIKTELLLEAVFSIRSVKSGYKEENCCNQFSLGLAVHLSSAREAEKRWRYTRSCQLSVESQPVKRRLGIWYEMAASLGVSCQLRIEFCTGGYEDTT
jgi:hypothetical protein